MERFSRQDAPVVGSMPWSVALIVVIVAVLVAALVWRLRKPPPGRA